MSGNQFLLLKEKRFTPLFVTQFLGAFHDNLFKSSLVVLLLYGGVFPTHADPKMLTTMAAGIFILPFVLFSAMGGQLADIFPKDRIMRIIKMIEIGIACVGAIALTSGSLFLSFATLFALGTHSAFFGPSKYSILPQHLKKSELIGGNALLNTGTFIAILGGTVAGTDFVTGAYGQQLVSFLLLLCAACGFAASRFIPPAPPVSKERIFDRNPLRETGSILRYTFSREPAIKRAVMGVGWFYFMGGMYMAQLPNFAHETLAADEATLARLLVLFSVGIAVGGLFNNRLLKGRIDTRYVPAAMLGVSLFAFDLYLSSSGVPGYLPWRTALDVVMISVCGGLFVVPLNAYVQLNTPEDHRARVQAGNAIVSSAFVVGASLVCGVLFAAGLGVGQIFVIFGAANAAVAYAFYRTKDAGKPVKKSRGKKKK
jgi:MFS family permease